MRSQHDPSRGHARGHGLALSGALASALALASACSTVEPLSATAPDATCRPRCDLPLPDAGSAEADGGDEVEDARPGSAEGGGADSALEGSDARWLGPHPSRFWTLPQNAPGFTELAARSVYSVALTSDQAWAATSAGLSVTGDWGVTWETRTTFDGLPANVVEDVAVDGPRVYVATSAGPAVSVDGLTFAPFPETSGAPSHAKAVAARGALVFVASDGRLWRSLDAGASFTSTVVTEHISDVSLTPTRVCLATISDGLGVSVDRGESFEFRAPGPSGGSGSSLSHVFCDEASDRVIAVSASQLWVSSDGEDFVERTTANGLCPGLFGEARAIGSEVLVASSFGVARSRDGGVSFECELRPEMPRALAWMPPKIVAGGSAGLGISTDEGASWTSAASLRSVGHSARFYSIWVDDERILASSAYGSFQSHDGGGTFADLGAGGWLRAIVRSGSWVAALPNAGLLVSKDDGRSFDLKTELDGLGSEVLLDLAIAEGRLFVATRGGLSISTDEGASFFTRRTTDGLPDDLVADVAVLTGKVFTATARGLAVSADAGLTFRTLPSRAGLEPLTSGDCSRVEAVPGHVYAACAGLTLFFSEDGGESFQRSPFSFPAAVTSIAGSGDSVAVGTRGGGAFLSPDGGRSFWDLRGYAGGVISELRFHDGYLYLVSDDERLDGGLFRSERRLVE